MRVRVRVSICDLSRREFRRSSFYGWGGGFLAFHLISIPIYPASHILNMYWEAGALYRHLPAF
jgi:hypothetical protein